MAEVQTLSLKNLLVPSKATEVDYPGLDGFKVGVSFLSREVLNNMRKKAMKTAIKSSSRNQPTEELDEQLFLKYYVEGCIKGWKGLKLSYVNQLAPIDLGDLDENTELAYSTENALMLMQNSPAFDSFISEIVTELSNFTKTSTAK